MVNTEALKVLREKDGRSSASMAEALGISLQYYCDIEAGRRTLKRTPALISRMAEVLNVPRSMLERRGSDQVAS